MKLDLNKQFTNLDSKSIDGDSMGKHFASQLAENSNPIAPIKAIDWAMSLWNSKPIEIDNADKQSLKDYTSKCEKFPTIWKAQILKEIDLVK